ncbi:MAG: M23 family metallopeptidase [Chthoniobacterales bacterium]
MLLLFFGSPSFSQTNSQAWLEFPTDNHALFTKNPEAFYMYVNRDFEGKKSQPWQGGSYGLVRGPQRGSAGIYYRAFHEGIDIKPLHRDRNGVPLDKVCAAANGRVVHASADPTKSNYGRYIVIEHRREGCPYYTLYAHLASVQVKVGQQVKQGTPIGVLGYSGRGLDRARAHLHFEFCLKFNSHFPAWHDMYGQGRNDHGEFNGRNLFGMNPADLLRAVYKNPDLSISQFITSSQKPMFELTVNESPDFELIRNYPWLVRDGEVASPAAWSITFSEQLIPMRARAESQRVGEPRVRWVGTAPQALSQLSRGLVTGSRSAPRLTDSGKRFAHLLTFPSH